MAWTQTNSTTLNRPKPKTRDARVGPPPLHLRRCKARDNDPRPTASLRCLPRRERLGYLLLGNTRTSPYIHGVCRRWSIQPSNTNGARSAAKNRNRRMASRQTKIRRMGANSGNIQASVQTCTAAVEKLRNSGDAEETCQRSKRWWSPGSSTVGRGQVIRSTC